MDAPERKLFQNYFHDRIKPAVQNWCTLYAGRVPFRAEEVAPDTLRERIFPGSPAQGYAFVIGGAPLCVQDNRGRVYVEYLMAPAAQELFGLPNAAAPPVQPCISRDEILRVLKADSGKDFPPDQIATRPTSYAYAVNGGVFVDAGEPAIRCV